MDVMVVCSDVERAIQHFALSLTELMNWKDDVLSVSALPSVVMTRLVVIVSKLCRTKNSIQKKGTEVVAAARNFTSGLQQTSEFQTLLERGNKVQLELKQAHASMRQLKAKGGKDTARVERLESGSRCFRWYRMCMQLLSMQQRLMDKRKWHAAHARVHSLQKQLEKQKQILVRSRLEAASYKNGAAAAAPPSIGGIVEGGSSAAGGGDGSGSGSGSGGGDGRNGGEGGRPDSAGSTASDSGGSRPESARNGSKAMDVSLDNLGHRTSAFSLVEVKEVRCRNALTGTDLSTVCVCTPPVVGLLTHTVWLV